VAKKTLSYRPAIRAAAADPATRTMPVSLAFAHATIELGDGTFTEPVIRERLTVFRSSGREPAGPLRMELRKASSAAGNWTPFTGPERPEGGFRLIGDAVELHPIVKERGALLALRLLFARAIEARRGILVHGSSFVVDGRAALVTGPSGAGKSTIARWALRAGASLLSDEVVGVLPEGRVLGTPFFSDRDLVGSEREARLAVTMTLVHGEREAFADRPAHDLVQAVCRQAFYRASGATARDALVCVAAALKEGRTGRFTCRNAPTAGTAIVDMLRSSACE